MNLLTKVKNARVRPGSIALWYIGGAGYLLKTAQTTMVIDPFIGPSSPPDWMRTLPAAFDPEEISQLGRVDAVLLTHEQGDHADPFALGPIARRTTAPIVGPAACIAVARDAGCPEERGLVLNHGASLEFADLRLTAVPMHDPGAKAPNGYVIEIANVTLLHAGDSLYFEGFAALAATWRFDAVCLSVGANPVGRTIYMDEVDAARVARDAGARTLVPQHFDLWQGLTLDARRVATVAHWYCPNAKVRPARFGSRLTISPAR